MMKVCALLLMLVLVPACDSTSPTLTEKITNQFQSSGRTFVDLAKVVPQAWDKVCILGPYSTPKNVYDTLGFDWPLDMFSSIATNDSIALLLFVNNQEVLEFVEHPRRDGDFANLSRRCVARKNSTFYHLTNPPKGWPGLFPKE